MIPYGHQSIDDGDVAAVVAALRSDWLTQGPAVEEFEQATADRVGAAHAVAFANGTAALHGACFAAGLGEGDVVATTPLTFAASATCARLVGARVRLLDIDPATLNLDPAAVPHDIDALVAVHYAGLPVDLQQMRTRPRVVIEDAAHAIGASTPTGPVGNCAHSDMCCFSFHPVKTITTGEGGLVTTNSPELADRLRCFRNHGIERRPELGGWYYEIATAATNYRMSDLHAALGSSQLRKLDVFIQVRNDLARRYYERLADTAVVTPPDAPPGTTHGRHLFPVQVRDRRRVYDSLRAAGIGVQVHYVPLYRHPLHASGVSPQDFPNTERVYEGLLSLPLYPTLSHHDQDRVIGELLALA
ncbi:MAG: aminotransferase class I/II-fold pyridoxal phosphate-dependent enzyme [Microthrixaceae bacterium]